MSIKTTESLLVQLCTMGAETLSGLKNYRVLCLSNNCLTSASCIVKGGYIEVTVGSGRCSGDLSILSNRQ